MTLGHCRQELSAAIAAEGLQPLMRPDTPADLRELLESCWRLDPSKRPSAAQLEQRLQAMQARGTLQPSAPSGACTKAAPCTHRLPSPNTAATCSLCGLHSSTGVFVCTCLFCCQSVDACLPNVCASQTDRAPTTLVNLQVKVMISHCMSCRYSHTPRQFCLQRLNGSMPCCRRGPARRAAPASCRLPASHHHDKH